MGWLEDGKTGVFQICFRFGDERIKRSSRTKDKRKALAILGRIEENLELLQRGRLIIPDDADVFEFLISDGSLNATQPTKQASLRLEELFARYRQSLPLNSLAPETLRVAEVHMRHIVRILDGTKQVRTIRRDDLQFYVNTRSTERGHRNREVSPGTIKKELATFRTLWGWARKSEFVVKPFPNDGLVFPRSRQKTPFSTWDQIEQRFRRGLPVGYTEADYWDCLYLDREQLSELLEYIRTRATYDFLYPMAVLAAHTGARRSELCRSIRDDIDLENGTVMIREKKKMKGRETYRHVPLSPLLQCVLSEWLAASPLSIFTFPADHRVARVRNGQRRENSESVSPDEATDHLSQTLSGSRWEKIRGWHIFRHSFISNCASLSVDQRMIDAWVGHQTDDMRKRYRHLFPSTQRKELDRVFGQIRDGSHASAASPDAE